MASFGDGKIEAYVGPVELGGADNLEQVIVDFIGGANKTLDIAIQELDSRTIAQAILDARWRGVRVQMFIDQDYVRSNLRGTPPTPPTPLPGETPARALERVQWLNDETELAINRQILNCAPTSTSRATTTRRSSTRSSSCVTTTAAPWRARRS